MQELFAQPLVESIQPLVSPLEQLRVSPKGELSRAKVLIGLHELGCGTAEQLLQLLRYRDGSLRSMRRTLHTLTDEKFVEPELPNKQTDYGRAPYVYFVGRKGRLYLKQLGVDITKRYRKREDRLHTGEWINHSLAVGDLYILARHMEYYVSDIWIEEFRHEWELNANPFEVTVPSDTGKTTERFASDSLYLFADRERKRFQLPEIYTTPIDEKRWKRKVRAYSYSFPLFHKQFGVRNMRVPVIIARAADFPKLTTEKRSEEQELWEQHDQEKRLANMLAWTQDEMARLGFRKHADVFYFSPIRHNRVSFKEFFFSPHWSVPFQTQKKALIPGREGY
jgi:hypothetical protein